MARNKPWRYTVWINEGAFFHEPWISDSVTERNYRYDKISPRIMKAMVQECKDRGRVTDPEKLRLIVDYVLERT